MARDKQHTRKRIIDEAYVLFRRRGYTRVNVDEIADAAGITKRTLYSHFESKDALLKSVLEEQHERAFAAFLTFGRQLVGKPETIVRLFFADLQKWAATSKWAGSGFTRLAMELADLPGHPARRIASAHKRLLEAHLAEAFAAAGVADAASCARQVWILSEGAMALMLIHGDRSYCKAAEKAALSVVAGER